MERSTDDKEWMQFLYDVDQAETSRFPLEQFAWIRDQLLKKDSDVTGMIQYLSSNLERMGYDIEHLEGLEWRQFKRKAREAQTVGIGMPTQTSLDKADEKLRRMKTVLDRWPRSIRQYYGWDSTSLSTIKLVVRCAGLYPDFERDFVPVANYVLLLHHLAAMRNSSYDHYIGFPRRAKRLSQRILASICKLKNSHYRLSMHGDESTLQAALRSSELVHAWTTSEDGALSIGTELLNQRMGYAWRGFVLKKDHYGLLKSKRGIMRS